jgi:hypothetical protein
MTAFPAAGSYPTGTIANSVASTNLEQLLAATKQLPGAAAEPELTIASGSVTPTTASFRIDTEGEAAADDLDVISQTNLPAGSIIILRSEDASRVVTLRHQQGGTGQLYLIDAANLALASPTMRVVFQNHGSQWTEIGRFYGSQSTAFRTWIGLAATATYAEASQAEAEAGSSAVKLMTPRRTAQYVTERFADDAVLRTPFTSAEQTIDAGDGASISHSLGGVPSLLQARLRCVDTELGYGESDEIILDSGYSSSIRAITVGANSTDVFYRVGSNGQVPIIDYGTGAATLLTASKWRLVIIAWA